MILNSFYKYSLSSCLAFFVIFFYILSVRSETFTASQCEMLFRDDIRNPSPNSLAKPDLKSRFFGSYSGVKVTSYRTTDTVGHMMRIEFPLNPGEHTPNNLLYNVVKAFPYFFSRFDFYVESNLMYAPDALRLSAKSTNGLKFLDVPFYRRQMYSERFFKKKFVDGIFPLSTYGGLFVHDRLGEHMIGSLLMPRWILEQAKLFVKFEDAWLVSSSAKKYPGVVKTIQETAGITGSWDLRTFELGATIISVAARKRVTRGDVEYLAKQLKSMHRMLTPGLTEIEAGMFARNRTPAIDEVLLARRELARSYLLPERTDSEYYSEAIRIYEMLLEGSSEMIREF